VLLGGLHAFVGEQLARDLGVRMQRPSDQRIQRLRRSTARKVRGALIELNKRALDLLLVRVLGEACERDEQQ
jgi:hypothetical protein